MGFEYLGASLVVNRLFWGGVDRSIYFEDQSELVAIEVRNKTTNWVLSTEFQPKNSSVSKKLPRFSFGGGSITPKPSGDLDFCFRSHISNPRPLSHLWERDRERDRYEGATNQTSHASTHHALKNRSPRGGFERRNNPTRFRILLWVLAGRRCGITNKNRAHPHQHAT